MNSFKSLIISKWFWNMKKVKFWDKRFFDFFFSKGSPAQQSEENDLVKKSIHFLSNIFSNFRAKCIMKSDQGQEICKKEEVAWCQKIPQDFFLPSPAALLSKGHFYVKIHFSTRTIFSSAVKKVEVVVIQIFLRLILRKQTWEGIFNSY